MSSADGRLTLSFPAGAVSQELEVTIRPAQGAPSGNIGAAYELGPAGTTFEELVTLSFSYDEGELGQEPPARLRVVTALHGKWMPILPGPVDTTARRVTGYVPHLSTYGIDTDPAGGDPEDKACYCNVATYQQCAAAQGMTTSVNLFIDANNDCICTEDGVATQTTSHVCQTGTGLEPWEACGDPLVLSYDSKKMSWHRDVFLFLARRETIGMPAEVT